MTTVETAVPVPVPVPASGRGRLALARVEGARALRHPVTVAGWVLPIGLWLYRWIGGGVDYPVLPEETRHAQALVLLLCGGAALVVANLAALRPHRHDTAEVAALLPMPPASRVVALLLAVVPLAAAAGGLAVGWLALLAAAAGPAGRPDPAELAAVPVLVFACGGAGVLLAQFVRSVVAAPLLVLAVGVTLVVGAAPGPGGRRWLLPLVLAEPAAPLPAELVSRPTGWHLAYLVGLAGVLVVAALAAAGGRGRRLVAAGLAGVLLAGVAAAAQLAPADPAVTAARAAAAADPAGRQVCQIRDRLTYCAFPDFATWAAGWDPVVRAVLRLVPPAEAGRPLVVRQRIPPPEWDQRSRLIDGDELTERARAWRAADAAAGTPQTVTAGTRWGDDRTAVGLAALVAYEVITRAGAGVSGLVCGSRAVLVGWLAGQATPQTAAGLRQADADSWGAVPLGELTLATEVTIPDREMKVVYAVLDRPAGEVAELVQRHWPELTAAGTTTERAGELLGVPVPPIDPDSVVCRA